MEVFNNKLSLLKVCGGIGTFAAAIFALNNLYSWYSEKSLDDISGNWRLRFTIEQTSFNPYKGLQLGYTVFVEQTGSKLTGNGDKVSENSLALPSSARTPIELNGTFDGKNIVLAVKEKGKKRESNGMIKLKISDNPKQLEGTFTTTAANASGKCTVELLK